MASHASGDPPILQWAKGIAAVSNNFGYISLADFAVTRAGEVFLVGGLGDVVQRADWVSGMEIPEVNQVSRPYLASFFIAKLDSDGKLLWARSSAPPAAGRTVGIDLNGNSYVLADVTGSAGSTLRVGDLSITAPTHFSNVLAKFDRDGHTEWAQIIVGPGPYGKQIAVDEAGEILLASSFVPGELRLVKYDSSGSSTWTNANNGLFLSEVNVTAMKQRPDGRLFVAGSYYGGGVCCSDFFGADQHFDGGTFLAEYSPAGQLLKIGRLSDLALTVSQIVFDSRGNYYLFGNFRNATAQRGTLSFGSVTLTNAGTAYGSSDIFRAKLDSGGILQWASLDGGTEGDYAGIAVIDDTDTLYWTGSIRGPSEIGSWHDGSPGLRLFLAKQDGAGGVDWVLTETNRLFERVGLDASGHLYVSGTAINPAVVVGTPVRAGEPVVARLGTERLPPFVVTKPRSQRIIEGGTLGLSVVAGGVPPFSYQWRFDGTPVQGATNRQFSIPDMRPELSGSYDVRICNSLGCTDTAPVRVEVIGFNSAPVLEWLRRPSRTTRDPATSSWYGYDDISTDAGGNLYALGVLLWPGTLEELALRDSAHFVSVYSATGAFQRVVQISSPWGGYWSIDFEASRVRADSRGNFFVLGATYPQTEHGSTTGYLLRYTASGALSWYRTADGGFGQHMAVDEQGNAYVIGATISRFSATGDRNQIANSPPVPSLALDHHHFDVDPVGNVYLFFSFSSAFSAWGVDFKSTGLQDMLLVRLDPLGHLVWYRQITGAPYKTAQLMTIGHSGRISIYGTISSDGDLNFGSQTVRVVGPTQFIGQYSLDGQLLWVRQLEGIPGTGAPTQISGDGQGNLYFCLGTFSETRLGGLPIGSPGSYASFVARFSSAGHLDWVHNALAFGASAAADPFGALYLSGATADDLTIGTKSLPYFADGTYRTMFLGKLTPNATLGIRRDNAPQGSPRPQLLLMSDYLAPYRIESSENLRTWRSLGVVTNQGGLFEAMELDPPPGRGLFYRARLAQ